MPSSPKVQWSSNVVVSKSKYSPLRPQFARHGTSEVAVTARNKLDDQAARSEHDLRLLVGHANTLDYVIDRLEARQRKRENNEHEKTAIVDQKQSSNRERSPSLHSIPEDPEHAVSTEQISLSSEQGPKMNAAIIVDESNKPAYVEFREDKASPALSIVALLDSDSEEDSADSESDAGGSEHSSRS